MHVHQNFWPTTVLCIYDIWNYSNAIYKYGNDELFRFDMHVSINIFDDQTIDNQIVEY